MKIIGLLLCLLGFILLNSCESEYEHRLENAKKLVLQELTLRASMNGNETNSGDFRATLEELQQEIAFHAHLSGNEDIFLEELDQYKQVLLTREQFEGEPEILLSKYP